MEGEAKEDVRSDNSLPCDFSGANVASFPMDSKRAKTKWAQKTSKGIWKAPRKCSSDLLLDLLINHCAPNVGLAVHLTLAKWKLAESSPFLLLTLCCWNNSFGYASHCVVCTTLVHMCEMRTTLRLSLSLPPSLCVCLQQVQQFTTDKQWKLSQCCQKSCFCLRLPKDIADRSITRCAKSQGSAEW